MDHLPYPDDAHFQAATTPFLVGASTPRYDGGDFISFASRVGWQSDTRDWFDCDANTAAERAQVWLYFGLLRSIFGSSVVETDFISTNDEHERILSNSKCLPGLIRTMSGTRIWRLLEACLRSLLQGLLLTCSGGLFLLLTLTVEGRNWMNRQLGSTSKLSSSFTEILKEVETQVLAVEQRHPASLAIGKTCLSIRALVWSIRNAAANRDPNVLRRSTLELSPSTYLKDVLLERGFCPHEIQSMQRYCSVATLHYISAYRYNDLGHQDCSTAACVANIVDMNGYITRHVDKDCECDFARADLTNLKHILDDGNIPIICVSGDDSALQVSVRPLSYNVPYVAISHAWSGGLGNPRSSSIPSCQISRIVSIIRPLFQSETRKAPDNWFRWPTLFRKHREEVLEGTQPVLCAFWMDTLCIPSTQEVEDNPDTRIKALSHMNRIYAQAAQVVVLDEAIRGNSSSDQLQLAASIFTSSWMTRCWTYLEGRLGHTLLFAIDSALHDPFTTFHRVARYSTAFYMYLAKWNDTVQVQREMVSSLYKLRPIQNSTIHGWQLTTLMEAWNEVVHRTTSRPSDRLIILALILDLSIYEAELIATLDQRLLAILKTQDVLPVSLLFSTILPGFQTNEHCPWLPRTCSVPLEASCGFLRKMADRAKGNHYFRIVGKLGSVYVVRVKRIKAAQMTHGLRVRSACLPELLIKVATASADENGDITTTSEEMLADLIYIIPKKPQHNIAPEVAEGFGCCLRVVEEHQNILTLAFDRTIAYSILQKATSSPVIADDRSQVQDSEPLDTLADLRLECDWSEWPTLNYRRSDDDQPMTTNHGPVHVYVIILFFVEVILGAFAVALLVLFFPLMDTLGRDFWWRATPAEWFFWSLCIVILLGRLYTVFSIELWSLNSELQAAEFQRWATSFAHRDPLQSSADIAKAVERPYQYHSWFVVGLVTIVGIAMLAIGLIVDRPMLYDIAILGGYLLIQLLFRVSTEMFWRLPVFAKYRSKITNWALDGDREGYVTLRIFNPLTFLSRKRLKRFLSEPNLLTHHTGALAEVFNDPLYLPENYARAK